MSEAKTHNELRDEVERRWGSLLANNAILQARFVRAIDGGTFAARSNRDAIDEAYQDIINEAVDIERFLAAMHAEADIAMRFAQKAQAAWRAKEKA